MTKNPFLNALAATTYIVIVASTMYFGSQVIEPVESVIIPIAFLSLFVLSAAMMGYFFLCGPMQLFFEQKLREGTRLFLATVAIFACTTAIIFILLISLGLLL